MEHEREQDHAQPVAAIASQPHGRPPILDGKLLRYLRSLRSKGGVINIYVVRTVAEACYPSMSQLAKFDMPRSWVQSIYRRIGYIRGEWVQQPDFQ